MSYSNRQPIKTPITIMVITMFIIAIAVLFFFSVPQTYFDPLYIKLLNRCESCSKAETLAIDDFKKGTYQVVAWGLISPESPTIDVAKILERDYKIKTVFGGCIRQEAMECYDTQMRTMLVSKFGETIYRNAYEQAKKNNP